MTKKIPFTINLKQMEECLCNCTNNNKGNAYIIDFLSLYYQNDIAERGSIFQLSISSIKIELHKDTCTYAQ